MKGLGGGGRFRFRDFKVEDFDAVKKRFELPNGQRSLTSEPVFLLSSVLRSRAKATRSDELVYNKFLSSKRFACNSHRFEGSRFQLNRLRIRSPFCLSGKSKEARSRRGRRLV